MYQTNLDFVFIFIYLFLTFKDILGLIYLKNAFF